MWTHPLVMWTPPTVYVDSPTSYVDSTHCTKQVHDWVSGLIWSGLRWKLMVFTLSFCSVQSKSGAILFISWGVICSSHWTVHTLPFQLDIGTITLGSKPSTVYSTWNCECLSHGPWPPPPLAKDTLGSISPLTMLYSHPTPIQKGCQWSLNGSEKWQGKVDVNNDKVKVTKVYACHADKETLGVQSILKVPSWM